MSHVVSTAAAVAEWPSLVFGVHYYVYKTAE